MEQLDDASTELMMGTGDDVMLHLGNAFFELAEDAATEYCEEDVETMQKLLDTLEEEEEELVESMNSLKKVLYGRFGKSINLET